MNTEGNDQPDANQDPMPPESDDTGNAADAPGEAADEATDEATGEAARVGEDVESADAASSAAPGEKTSPPDQPAPPSMIGFLRKALIAAVVVVVGAHVLLWTVLWFGQDAAIFPTNLVRKSQAPQLPRYVEVISVDVGEGEKTEMWFIRGRGVSASNPGPVVMYFHGNAELIDDQLSNIEPYISGGISVLLSEYRGYGRSGGKPSQENIQYDMKRAFDDLKVHWAVDPKKIIFHGKSLGGAVAANLARVRKPAGLILQSTFTSAKDMAPEFRAPQFLFKHPYRTADFVKQTDVPLLIFHGRQDDVIPFSHGEKLAELAQNETFVVYDADHNSFPGPTNHEDFWMQIIQFLKQNQLMPGSVTR